MKNCTWCEPEDQRWLVLETADWRVYLADEQDYVGRCILVSKRHCGSLAELNAREWMALKELVDRLEAFYREKLGAEVCNWSCLMNDFCKDAAPDPHLHIHVRPRYREAVVINGREYLDAEFGHHYTPHKEVQLRGMDRQAIYGLMKTVLEESITG